MDCFQYSERFDYFPSFYCNNCNCKYPAYSNSKIIKAPKTLIINLNHGRGLEYNIKINYFYKTLLVVFAVLTILN